MSTSALSFSLAISFHVALLIRDPLDCLVIGIAVTVRDEELERQWTRFFARFSIYHNIDCAGQSPEQMMATHSQKSPSSILVCSCFKNKKMSVHFFEVDKTGDPATWPTDASTLLGFSMSDRNFLARSFFFVLADMKRLVFFQPKSITATTSDST